MRTRIPTAVQVVVAATMFVLASCGTTNPTISASASPEASASSPLPSSDLGSATPSQSPIATPSPSPSAAPDLSARPFTVLILGGDDGFRTDAIVVAGIDPVHRRISLASVPRDTANVPLPDGGIFNQQKVNAFYDFAGANPGRYPQGAGRATADLVGRMLGIRVDYFAATSFGGFVNLIDAMRGVRISLAKPVVDPYYQVPSGAFGVRFPAGPQTLLGQRALIFARTRQGDNDFERERRHQLFLLAAGRELLARPALVEALLTVRSNLITDFPLGEVASLVHALASSTSWPVQQVVLGPTRYEYNVPCSCGYALQPRLTQMRAEARRLFPWAVKP